MQKKRERGILKTFYFPGTALPDDPAQKEAVSKEASQDYIAQPIPFNDVPVLTKVSDFSNHPWPHPQGLPSNHHLTGMVRKNSVQRTAPMEATTSNNAFGNAFGAPVQQGPPVLSMPLQSNVVDLNNPCAQSFENIAPPLVNPDPWAAVVADAAATAAAENPGFAGFGAIPNAPAPNTFTAPFGFQFPGHQMASGPAGIGNFGGNFRGPPGVITNQFEGDNRGGGGRSRDVDMRRHERDRDYRNNNRDNNRCGGGRDRDRDRDRDGDRRDV